MSGEHKVEQLSEAAASVARSALLQYVPIVLNLGLEDVTEIERLLEK